MKADTIKYFAREDIESSPPVVIITEEMIQEAAEANWDRKLTDQEIRHVQYAIYEDSSDHFHLYELICGAIDHTLE